MKKLCVKVVSGITQEETYIDNIATKFFQRLDAIVYETVKYMPGSQVEIYDSESNLLGKILTQDNFVRFKVDHEKIMSCMVG